MRRKAHEQATGTVAGLPHELVTNGVPPGVTRLDLIFEARQVRDVARWRFTELTGLGHSSWVKPDNVPGHVFKAGVSLGERLAKGQ